MHEHAPRRARQGDDFGEDRIMASPPDGNLGPEYLAIEGPDGLVLLVPRAAFDSAEEPRPTAARRRSPEERDAGLRAQFDMLRPLLPGLPASAWASSPTPYTALMEDCRALLSQPLVARGVATYLQKRPSVRSAAEMLVTAISMSANADWRRTPEVVRAVAARGWFLGRWIPTFLVVDGPITRFMRSEAFKDQKPRAEIFKAARKLICEDPIMKSTRNSIAHWSFGWRVVSGDSNLVLYDENTGAPKLELQRRQVDAMHLVAFTIVDILNEVFLRPGALPATETE